MIKVLFIGDIVSRLGRQAVNKYVHKLIVDEQIDIVVANCENATDGRGISLNHYQDLKDSGIDLFTAGEHIYRVSSIKENIDDLQIAVPANFYSGLPGKRVVEFDTGKNGVYYFVSLLGTTFMGDSLVYNPFHTIDKILEDLNTKNVFIDFHGEATSEKQAFKHYVDGRVLGVVGTHTHVQTADEQITSKGTAFITDLGMTGSTESVIGVKKEIIVNRLSKGEKSAFEWEKEGPFSLNGCIISIDTTNQIAKNIVRVSLKGS